MKILINSAEYDNELGYSSKVKNLILKIVKWKNLKLK